MTTILRKLFFWDAPAQGAFFGLTLLPTAIWLGFSLWCGIMVVDYSLLLLKTVRLTLFFASLAVLMYIAFLLGRMLALNSLKLKYRWWRIGVALAFLALSLVYAVLGGWHYMTDFGIYWQWVPWGLFIINSILLVFPIIITSWKTIAGTLAWLGCFHVFWSLFAFAFQTFRSGGIHTLNMTDWISASDAIHQWFRLDTSTGCFCFAFLGILLLIAGYLLYGSLLAGYTKTSLRGMFSGEVRCLLGLVAVSYVAFLVLALWETASYQRAINELEKHFGHPLTSTELERQFYEGRPANPEFWKELEDTLNEHYDSLKNNKFDEFSNHPNAILPETIHTSHKKVFQESAALQKLAQMTTAPIPPPARDYSDKQQLLALPLPELSKLRELAKLERQRIIYALEDGKLDAISSALNRMDAIREYLLKDTFTIAYLVEIAVTSFRLQALEKILASGLPTDEWLAAQSEKLAEIEQQTEESEKRFLYGESVCVLNVFHWLAYYAGTHDAPLGGLHFHSLRFFFPQGWWLAANNLKGTARLLRVRHFSQLPDKRTGYASADMMLPGSVNVSVKKRSIIASSRVMRGLIQAELHKRRTGEYPDNLEGLPLDPFSDQPLKYRKGPCQVQEEVYLEKSKEEENGDDGLFSTPSTRFEKRERTVNAVQIWSVGPNGIDDGGIFNKPEYGSTEKKKDDIRFIIPMQLNMKDK